MRVFMPMTTASTVLIALSLLITDTTAKKGGGAGGGGGPPADPVIAYNDGGDLMVMNADGSNPTLVLAGAGDADMAPSWSPDGSRIAFNGPDGLYVVNLDGTGLERIYDGFAGQPAWSPKGTLDGHFKIAFWSDEGQGPDLFLVNTDGTGLQNLTATAGQGEFDAAWSPDAGRIAARVTNPPSESIVVYTLKLGETSGELEINTQLNVNVTDVQGSELQAIGAVLDNSFQWPDWSRAGNKLVFSVYVGSTYDLWIVDLGNLANPIQVTDTGSENERHASWSPDDSRLVCWRRRTTRAKLVTMNPDGSGLAELVSGDVRWPDWRRTQ